MANGKKGALIIQGLQAGGFIGGIEAGIVASTSGDNLPGVTIPAETQVTPQEPVSLSGTTYPGAVNPFARSSGSLTESDWIFIVLGVIGIFLTIYYGRK